MIDMSSGVTRRISAQASGENPPRENGFIKCESDAIPLLSAVISKQDLFL